MITDPQSFDDFNFDYDLLDGIEAMGYKAPTPIQKQAIPVILAGHDLVATAQTGTGKTAAFVLPILDSILQSPKGGINTLVIVPTRELAVQIDQQIEAMSYYIDVSSIAVYGGTDGLTWEAQKKAIRNGVDVVIATPGRLISMLQMGGFTFNDLKHLVLDEADRMLDMGFFDDIIRIVSTLPEHRQTVMFSATMPPKMRKFANQILRNPVDISIAISKPAEGIDQQSYIVFNEQKNKLLTKLFKDAQYGSAIIFGSRKETVKRLEKELKNIGVAVKAFHSDLEQAERELLMQDFRSRKIPVLIGTDVLSRGIDVEGIELVLNYDVPPDPEDYVHRIGRTARAEKKGTAITFVNPDDMRRFASIEKLIGREIKRMPVPEEFGAAPQYDPNTRYSGGSGGGSRGGRPGGGGNRSGGGQRSGGGSGGQRSGSGGGRSGGSGGR